MTARFTVDLTDPVVAAHFARAIATHAAWARTQRIAVPQRLIDAGLDAKRWATAVHTGPDLPCDCGDGHGDGVGLVMSFPRAAELLGKSLSTVKRLVGDGQLPAVRVGGSRCIRRADLEDFVADLAIARPEGHE